MFMVLRENFRGIIVGAALVVCLLLILVFITLRSSPTVSVQRVTGTVENVLTDPLSPKNAVGGGFQYRYGIRLHDSGAFVFANGEVNRPHTIGSEVSLERQHHQNGADTYRLLED
jgi:hypothetical protein